MNQYQSLFGYSGDYDSQGAVFPTSFGNAIISWEKSENLDVALDFGLFNKSNRFCWLLQRDTKTFFKEFLIIDNWSLVTNTKCW